jgi:hypothetical protein
MTTRWPKKWRFVSPDPWWTATHIAPPEVNAGPAPEPAAHVGEPKDHPLVKAVLARFPGAQAVNTRSATVPLNSAPLNDAEYCEAVVVRWRDMPFQDARDCAAIDALRSLYARLRRWRPPYPATPFRPGTGVLQSVGEYVRKTESYRAEPQPDTLEYLSVDLKAVYREIKALERIIKKQEREAAKAKSYEPAAD